MILRIHTYLKVYKCWRILPILIPYTPSSSPFQAVDAVLLNRDEVLLILREKLHMARNRMKQQAD